MQDEVDYFFICDWGDYDGDYTIDDIEDLDDDVDGIIDFKDEEVQSD